ncbi:MAG TPA: NAD(P)-dependent oxidoreductase [Xanthobacteraceae bacterium]|nr:NAD(P)-dependent oxidoreductase [Xanthobacteraceae bacterium]
MKPKVFVVQPIPEVALDVLREEAEVTVYPYMDRQISVDELVANAKRSDWLFVLHETNVTADVINANPNLKGIGAMASNNPLVDMEAANARKIPVIIEDPKITFPGVAPTTADLTMAMLLGLAYRLVESDRYTRAGKFRQEQTMALMGVGCPGKTVGLVGMGKLGENMAPRIRAFGMHTVYTKRTRLAPRREQELGLEWTPDLDDLLRRSDFVCLVCDYNPTTHKLIGKRELALMKPEAFLINTARGRIVDEPELIQALQEKRIAGAGLDVYWNEPPVTQDPSVPEELCKLDNVILAPHNGGATWDVRGRKAMSVAQGMVAMMRGERPAALLNPEIYEGR